MTHLASEYKFPECEGCINHDMDPFPCRYCKNGSNFESDGDNTEEELTYHEFQEFVRREGL